MIRRVKTIHDDLQKILPGLAKKIINFAGYLITWIVSVKGAAHGYVWPGFFVAITFLSIHFLLCDSIKHELKLILIVTFLGCSIDGLLFHFHYLTFASANPWYPLSPPWMWGTWLVFGSTLNSAFAILQRFRSMAASSGLVDVPISYLMAAKIGALHFTQLLNSLFILSMAWFVLMPIVVWIARPSLNSKQQLQVKK